MSSDEEEDVYDEEGGDEGEEVDYDEDVGEDEEVEENEENEEAGPDGSASSSHVAEFSDNDCDYSSDNSEREEREAASSDAPRQRRTGRGWEAATGEVRETVVHYVHSAPETLKATTELESGETDHNIDIFQLVRYTSEELLSCAWPLVPQELKCAAFPPFGSFPDVPNLNQLFPDEDQLAQFMRKCAVEIVNRHRKPTPSLLRTIAIRSQVQKEAFSAPPVTQNAAEESDSEEDEREEVASNRDEEEQSEETGGVFGAPPSVVTNDATVFDWIVAFEVTKGIVPASVLKNVSQVLNHSGFGHELASGPQELLMSRGMEVLLCEITAALKHPKEENAAIEPLLFEVLFKLCLSRRSLRETLKVLGIALNKYKACQSLEFHDVSLWTEAIETEMPAKISIPIPTLQETPQTSISLLHAFPAEQRTGLSVQAFVVDARDNSIVIFTSNGSMKLSLLPPFTVVVVNPSIVLPSCHGAIIHEEEIIVSLATGDLLICDRTNLQKIREISCTNKEELIRAAHGLRGFYKAHLVITKKKQRPFFKGSGCSGVSDAAGKLMQIQTVNHDQIAVQFWLHISSVPPMRAATMPNESTFTVVSIAGDRKPWVEATVHINRSEGLSTITFSHSGQQVTASVSSSLGMQCDRWVLWSASLRTTNGVSTWAVYRDGSAANVDVMCPGSFSKMRNAGNVSICTGSFYGMVSDITVWNCALSGSVMARAGMSGEPACDERTKKYLLVYFPLNEGLGRHFHGHHGMLWRCEGNITWPQTTTLKSVQRAGSLPVDFPSNSLITTNNFEIIVHSSDVITRLDAETGEVFDRINASEAHELLYFCPETSRFCKFSIEGLALKMHNSTCPPSTTLKALASFSIEPGKQNKVLKDFVENLCIRMNRLSVLHGDDPFVSMQPAVDCWCTDMSVETIECMLDILDHVDLEVHPTIVVLAVLRLVQRQLKGLGRRCATSFVRRIQDIVSNLSGQVAKQKLQNNLIQELSDLLKDTSNILLLRCIGAQQQLKIILGCTNFNSVAQFMTPEKLSSLVATLLVKQDYHSLGEFLNRLEKAVINETDILLTSNSIPSPAELGNASKFSPSTAMCSVLLAILSQKGHTFHHSALQRLRQIIDKTVKAILASKTVHQDDLLRESAVGKMLLPLSPLFESISVTPESAHQVIDEINLLRTILFDTAKRVCAGTSEKEQKVVEFYETKTIHSPKKVTQLFETMLSLSYAASILLEVTYLSEKAEEQPTVRASLQKDTYEVDHFNIEKKLQIDRGGTVMLSVLPKPGATTQGVAITCTAKIVLPSSSSHWLQELFHSLVDTSLALAESLLLNGVRTNDEFIITRASCLRGGLTCHARQVPIQGLEAGLNLHDRENLLELVDKKSGPLLAAWEEIYNGCKKILQKKQLLEPFFRYITAALAWHKPHKKTLAHHLQDTFKSVQDNWIPLTELLRTEGHDEEAVKKMCEECKTFPATEITSSECVKLLARCRWLITDIVPRMLVQQLLEERESFEEPYGRQGTQSPTGSHPSGPFPSGSATAFSRNSSTDFRTHSAAARQRKPRKGLSSRVLGGTVDEVVNDLVSFVITGPTDPLDQVADSLKLRTFRASCFSAAYTLLGKVASQVMDSLTIRSILSSILRLRDKVLTVSQEEEHYITPLIGCGFDLEAGVQEKSCLFVQSVMRAYNIQLSEAKSAEALLHQGTGFLQLCAVLCHPWESTDALILGSETFALLDRHVDAHILMTQNASNPVVETGFIDLKARALLKPNSVTNCNNKNCESVEGENGFGVQIEDANAYFTASKEWDGFSASDSKSPQIFYFEVSFDLCLQEEMQATVGLTEKQLASCHTCPSSGTGCYYSSKGTISGAGLGNSLPAPGYTVGDVIGCGLILPEKSVFFTKNGEFLGIMFSTVPFAKVFPMFGAEAKGGLISTLVNFGSTQSFRYDFTRLHSSCRKRDVTSAMLSHGALIVARYLITLCYHRLAREGSKSIAVKETIAMIVDAEVAWIASAIRRQFEFVQKQKSGDENSGWKKKLAIELLQSLFSICDVAIQCCGFIETLPSTHKVLGDLILESVNFSCIMQHPALHLMTITRLERFVKKLRPDLLANSLVKLTDPATLVRRLVETASGKGNESENEASAGAVQYEPLWLRTLGRNISQKNQQYLRDPLPKTGVTRIGFRITRANCNEIGAGLGGCYYVGVSNGRRNVNGMRDMIGSRDFHLMQDADDGDHVPHIELERGSLPRNARGRVYGHGEVVWVEVDADNQTITFYRDNNLIGTAFTGIDVSNLYPVVWLFNDDSCCELLSGNDNVQELDSSATSLVQSCAISCLQSLHVTGVFGPSVDSFLNKTLNSFGVDIKVTLVALGILGGNLSYSVCDLAGCGSVVVRKLDGPKCWVYLEGDDEENLLEAKIADLKPTEVSPPLLASTDHYKISLPHIENLSSRLHKLIYLAARLDPVQKEEETTRAGILAEASTSWQTLCSDFVALNCSGISTATSSLYFVRRGKHSSVRYLSPNIITAFTRNDCADLLMACGNDLPFSVETLMLKASAVPIAIGVMKFDYKGPLSFAGIAELKKEAQLTAVQVQLQIGETLHVVFDHNAGTISTSAVSKMATRTLESASFAPSEQYYWFLCLPPKAVAVLGLPNKEFPPRNPVLDPLLKEELGKQPNHCRICGGSMDSWFRCVDSEHVLCKSCHDAWEYPEELFVEMSLMNFDILVSPHPPQTLSVGSLVSMEEAPCYNWSSDRCMNVKISNSTAITLNDESQVASVALPSVGVVRFDVTIEHLATTEGGKLRDIIPFHPRWGAKHQISVFEKRNGFVLSDCEISTTQRTVFGVNCTPEKSKSQANCLLGVTSETKPAHYLSQAELKSLMNNTMWCFTFDERSKELDIRNGCYFLVDPAQQLVRVAQSLPDLVSSTIAFPIGAAKSLRIFAFTHDACTLTLLPGYTSSIGSFTLQPFKIGVTQERATLLDTVDSTAIFDSADSLSCFRAGETLSVILDWRAKAIKFFRDGIMLQSAEIPSSLMGQRACVFVNCPLAGSIVKLAPPLNARFSLGRIERLGADGLALVQSCTFTSWKQWSSRSDLRAVAMAGAPDVKVGASIAVLEPGKSRAWRGTVKTTSSDKLAILQEGQTTQGRELEKKNCYAFNEDVSLPIRSFPQIIQPIVAAVPKEFKIGERFRTGSSSYNGMMFDCRTSERIEVTGVSAMAHTGTSNRVLVFGRLGSMTGFERNSAGWTTLFDGTKSMVSSELYYLPFRTELKVEANSVFALYIQSNHNCAVGFYNEEDGCRGRVGDQIDSDGILSVMMGRKSEGREAFNDIPSSGRGFNGTIHYKNRGGYELPYAPPVSKSKVELPFDCSTGILCKCPVNRPVTKSDRVLFGIEAKKNLSLLEITVPVFLQNPSVQQVQLSTRFNSAPNEIEGLESQLVSVFIMLGEATEFSPRENAWKWVSHARYTVKEDWTFTIPLPRNHEMMQLNKGRYSVCLLLHSNNGVELCAPGHGMPLPQVQNKEVCVDGLFGQIKYVVAGAVTFAGPAAFVPGGSRYNMGSSASYNGIMFDLQSKTDIVLDEVFFIPQTTSSNISVKIFWRESSMVGNERNSNGWREVYQGSMQLVDLSETSVGRLGLQMKANARYSLYINTNNSCGVRFWNGSDGPVGNVGSEYDTDGVLQLYVGRKSESSTPFSDIPTDGRVFRGKITYRAAVTTPKQGTESHQLGISFVQAYLVSRILRAMKYFFKNCGSTDKQLIQNVTQTVQSIACGTKDTYQLSELEIDTFVEGAIEKLGFEQFAGTELCLSTRVGEASHWATWNVGDWAYDTHSNTWGKVLQVDVVEDILVVQMPEGEVKASMSHYLPMLMSIDGHTPYSVGPNFTMARDQNDFTRSQVLSLTGPQDGEDALDEDDLNALLDDQMDRAQSTMMDVGPSASFGTEALSSFVDGNILHFSISGATVLGDKGQVLRTPSVVFDNAQFSIEIVANPVMEVIFCSLITDKDLRNMKGEQKYYKVQTFIGAQRIREHLLALSQLSGYGDGISIPWARVASQLSSTGDLLIKIVLEPTIPPLTPTCQLERLPLFELAPVWLGNPGCNSLTVKENEVSFVGPIASVDSEYHTNYVMIGICNSVNVSVGIAIVGSDCVYHPSSKTQADFCVKHLSTIEVSVNCATSSITLNSQGEVKAFNSDELQPGVSYCFFVKSVQSTQVHLLSKPSDIPGFISTSTVKWVKCDPHGVQFSDVEKGQKAARISGGANSTCVVGSTLPMDGKSRFTLFIARSDRERGGELGSGHYAGVCLASFSNFSAGYSDVGRNVNEIWAVQDVQDSDSQSTQASFAPISGGSSSAMFLSETKLTFILNRDTNELSLIRDGVDLGVIFRNLPTAIALAPFVRLDNSNAFAVLVREVETQCEEHAVLPSLSLPLTPQYLWANTLLSIHFETLLEAYPMFAKVFKGLTTEQQVAMQSQWNGSNSKGETRLTFRVKMLLTKFLAEGLFSEVVSGEKALEKNVIGEKIIDACNLIAKGFALPAPEIVAIDKQSLKIAELPVEYEVLGIQKYDSNAVSLLYFSNGVRNRRTLRFVPTSSGLYEVLLTSPVPDCECVMKQHQICASQFGRYVAVITDYAEFPLARVFEDPTKFPSLTPNHRGALAYELMCAVEHYHLAGIAHGHIHPENMYIYFDSNDQVQLKMWDTFRPGLRHPYASYETSTKAMKTRMADVWSVGAIIAQLCSEKYKVNVTPKPDNESGSAHPTPVDAQFAELLQRSFAHELLIYNPAGRPKLSAILEKTTLEGGVAVGKAKEEGNFRTAARRGSSGSYNGIMMDIISKKHALKVHRIHFIPDTNSSTTIRVYVRPGGFRGNESSSTGWNKIHQQTLRLTDGQEMTLTGFEPFEVQPGQRCGFFLHTENSSGVSFHSDTNGDNLHPGDPFDENNDLQISVGKKSESSTPFNSVQSVNRYYKGGFTYDVVFPKDPRRSTLVVQQEPRPVPPPAWFVGSPVMISGSPPPELGVASGATGHVFRHFDKDNVVVDFGAGGRILMENTFVAPHPRGDPVYKSPTPIEMSISPISTRRKRAKVQWVAERPAVQFLLAADAEACTVPLTHTGRYEVDCDELVSCFVVVDGERKVLPIALSSTEFFVDLLCGFVALIDETSKSIKEIFCRMKSGAKVQLGVKATDDKTVATIFFSGYDERLTIARTLSEEIAIVPMKFSPKSTELERTTFLQHENVSILLVARRSTLTTPLVDSVTFYLLEGDSSQKIIVLLHPDKAEEDIVQLLEGKPSAFLDETASITFSASDLQGRAFHTGREMPSDESLVFSFLKPRSSFQPEGIAPRFVKAPECPVEFVDHNHLGWISTHNGREYPVTLPSLVFSDDAIIALRLQLHVPLEGKLQGFLYTSDESKKIKSFYWPGNDFFSPVALFSQRRVYGNQWCRLGEVMLIWNGPEKKLRFLDNDDSILDYCELDADFRLGFIGEQLNSGIKILGFAIENVIAPSNALAEARGSLFQKLFRKYGKLPTPHRISYIPELLRHSPKTVDEPVLLETKDKPECVTAVMLPHLTTASRALMCTIASSGKSRVEPEGVLKTISFMGTKDVRHVLHQFTKHAPTEVIIPIIAEAFKVLRVFQGDSEELPLIRACLLLISTTLTNDTILKGVLCSYPMSADLIIDLLRTATVTARSTRHNTLRVSSSVIAMSDCLPHHIAKLTRPLVAMLHSLSSSGKTNRPVVRAGVEVLVQLYEKFKQLGYTEPCPGSGTKIPFHTVFAARSILDSLNKMTPLDPCLLCMDASDELDVVIEKDEATQTMKCTRHTPFGVNRKAFAVRIPSELPSDVMASFGWSDVPDPTTVLFGCMIMGQQLYKLTNGDLEETSFTVSQGLVITLSYDPSTKEVKIIFGDQSMTIDVTLPVDRACVMTPRYTGTNVLEILYMKPLVPEGLSDPSRISMNRALSLLGQMSPELTVAWGVQAMSYEFYCQLNSFHEHCLATSQKENVPFYEVAGYPEVEKVINANAGGSSDALALSPLQPYLKVLETFGAICLALYSLVDLRERGTLSDHWAAIKSIAPKPVRKEIHSRVLRELKQESGSPHNVDLHLMDALQRSRRGLEATLQASIFAQLFRQLGKSKSSTFFTNPMFKANLIGFGSQDAGGPYREVMSQLGTEIMTTHTRGGFQMNPLFHRTPNGDAVMPSPILPPTPLHVAMYEFFGKLLAFFLMGESVLCADFAPAFWKLLLGERLSEVDVGGIDANFFRNTTPESLSVTTIDDLEEEYPGFLEYWTTFKKGFSNSEVMQNYQKLLSQALRAHAIEKYEWGIEAIRQGFCSIIPYHCLLALYWKDIEDAICGQREVTIEALRHNLEIQLPRDHEQMLWNVLQSFSSADRGLLLRFGTGQQRLPLQKPLRIKELSIRSDGALPEASTCFNQMSIPAYSSETVMHDKILYAVRQCNVIDADGQARGRLHYDATASSDDEQ